jgi:hypothetical protein
MQRHLYSVLACFIVCVCSSFAPETKPRVVSASFLSSPLTNQEVPETTLEFLSPSIHAISADGTYTEGSSVATKYVTMTTGFAEGANTKFISYVLTAKHIVKPKGQMPVLILVSGYCKDESGRDSYTFSRAEIVTMDNKQDLALLAVTSRTKQFRLTGAARFRVSATSMFDNVVLCSSPLAVRNVLSESQYLDNKVVFMDNETPNMDGPIETNMRFYCKANQGSSGGGFFVRTPGGEPLCIGILLGVSAGNNPKAYGLDAKEIQSFAKRHSLEYAFEFEEALASTMP